MAILEVRNLKFGYQNEELYNSVSFDIYSGEHATLVGPNGVGKSTLMKLIVGKLTPDSGTISWLNGVNYSYLDQQLEVKKDMKIKEYLYGVYSDLFEREEKMNEIYNTLMNYSDDLQTTLLERAESIREYLELHDFYNIETEINNVIVGLGLNNIDLNRTLSNLSGGEKAKVYLSKLLLEKPDCILMDEPTNFLDKEHVAWLTNYLSNFSGAFLVISHDKEFLKGIAKVVLSLENSKVERYKGDYNFYLKEKDVRLEKQKEAYIRQQSFIKKTEMFIEKNIVRASTTRQAKSRRKMLEKLERIEKPKDEYRVRINFPFSRNLGDEVLKLKDLEVGYNGIALLPKINYTIKRNERVEIIGKNGIGKTTLIKTILGEIKPISGSFSFNPSVDINYFSQEEDINLNLNAVEYIRSFYPLMSLEDVLKTLAPLGIRGDLRIKPLKELSGGEVSRVRLSLMTLKKSNLLILDEPTNHLDQLTKEVLHEAIMDFDGSVIIVSHEKGFAESLVDTIIKF